MALREAGEGLSGPMQENEVPTVSVLSTKGVTSQVCEPKELQPKEPKEQRVRLAGLALGDSSSSSGIGGSGQRISQSGFGSSLAAPPALGYNRQRKRPAEACFVDDEFRTPDLEPTRSPPGTPLDSVARTPPRRRYRAQASPSSVESRAARASEGRRLERNDTQGTSTSVESPDSNKENKAPDDEQEGTPEPMARVVRSPSRTPGRRTLEIGNVLQELALSVPEELMHQGQTPESPQSEGSPVPANRQAQSQNLAELLDEQIATSSRHNFEIYVDPENRQP